MNPKLKPCPFGRCRAKAEVVSYRNGIIWNYRIETNHDVECPLYHAVMNGDKDRQLVIDRWNAR